MKVNVGTTLTTVTGGTSVDDFVAYLARMRDQEFERVWIAQLPWELDLLSMLAVAFREVGDIDVAAGVLPIQVAHPMLMAQRALTLSVISGGRFTLGLGLNHPGMSQDLWGISSERPIRRMSQYLDGLLPLLAGEPVNAVGDIVTTRGKLEIPHAEAPRVYLAALGPQMLRLAARRTSGTVTWMSGPQTLASHIGPVLRDAAAASGLPKAAVRVVACVPICVTDDTHAMRAVAAEEFALYGTLPSYRAMLDREGFTGPEDAALIGDERTVADRIEEFRRSEVDEFVGFPFGESAETVARSLASLRTARGLHGRTPEANVTTRQN